MAWREDKRRVRVTDGGSGGVRAMARVVVGGGVGVEWREAAGGEALGLEPWSSAGESCAIKDLELQTDGCVMGVARVFAK